MSDDALTFNDLMHVADQPPVAGRTFGTPHRMVVTACFPKETEEDADPAEVDYEIDHLEECGSIARYTGPDGEDVFEPNCGLWWVLSEGGGLLEELGDDFIDPGEYWIRHWTHVYPATPDHGTEYDMGLELVEGAA